MSGFPGDFNVLMQHQLEVISANKDWRFREVKAYSDEE
jgi:hypothetical protein